MLHGSWKWVCQVTFREMADEHPDADAGDVIFVLKQQARPRKLLMLGFW